MAVHWREVVKEYRYIRTKFKDPYKMLVTADKCMDEADKLLKEGKELALRLHTYEYNFPHDKKFGDRCSCQACQWIDKVNELGK